MTNKNRAENRYIIIYLLPNFYFLGQILTIYRQIKHSLLKAPDLSYEESNRYLKVNRSNFPHFSGFVVLRTLRYVSFSLVFALAGYLQGKIFCGLLIAANYLIKKFSGITFCLPVSMGIYIHGNTDVRVS